MLYCAIFACLYTNRAFAGRQWIFQHYFENWKLAISWDKCVCWISIRMPSSFQNTFACLSWSLDWLFCPWFDLWEHAFPVGSFYDILRLRPKLARAHSPSRTRQVCFYFLNFLFLLILLLFYFTFGVCVFICSLLSAVSAKSRQRICQVIFGWRRRRQWRRGFCVQSAFCKYQS